MRYFKLPILIEAHQWFKNGDHPDDQRDFAVYSTEQEGCLVRYYRRPDDDGQRKCDKCEDIMHNHGWVDTLEGGHIVCPGDWIMTGIAGEHYPCKPDIFARTYVPETEPCCDDARFVRHIVGHLKEGEHVICKICNKSISKIAREAK